MSVRSLTRVVAATAALGGAVAAVGGVAGPASAATVRPATVRPHAADYRVWATNVNIRESTWDPATCALSPSVANCPDIQGQAQPGHDIYVLCQRAGQTVGGNPYWVNVQDNTNGAIGWMASYYIDYPDNRLPNVPDCA
ncbi:hypothetical protein [Actinocrinis sp.]|uniref:hypothetical protein n=1 Tax=Actinocrinis sp. TaxID=1920516 RepID=UPI002D44047D|nr:hypothetical protein [Actinocrinis sp.]HZP55141.1 hypothetical protein [Actinocrinis sp.]